MVKNLLKIAIRNILKEKTYSLYRIDINSEALSFLFSALLAFLITLNTVGYHTIRAAISSPVNALRNE